MAIGSTNRLGGYSIGSSRSTGSQLGQKTAADLLGVSSNPLSLFAITLQGSSGNAINTKQVILKGLQDQIDRIQGYRTNLSTAEKQKLADYQSKITDLNKLAQTRLLTKTEIADRSDAYVQAYKILGKEYSDFSSDDFVTQKSQELTDLLATKPKGAEAARLERLQHIRANLQSQYKTDGGAQSETLVQQGLSVTRQISELTAPRPISSLSPADRKKHDELVDAINSHVGFELELNSTKKLQIERLQTTISLVQRGSSMSGIFA